MPTSLSIVIPTLDEAAAISRCVRSAWKLGADHSPPGGCGIGDRGSGGLVVQEVLVVDGRSSDNTPELAAAAGARVLTAPRGRGQQMNAAAAAATGDALLFLHADTRLPPEAGDQIARAFRDPRVVHGAFRQRIDADGAVYRWLERGNAFRVQRLGTPYGDQALFVRRDAFFAVGGFPDQPLMEDVAIARRLRRLGRPALLDGPLRVSPRRWREKGVFRTTALNWMLFLAWSAGARPETLARWYYGGSSAPGPATPTAAASAPPEVVKMPIEPAAALERR